MTIPEQAVQAYIKAFGNTPRTKAMALKNEQKVRHALTAAAPHLAAVRVKKLEWEMKTEHGKRVYFARGAGYLYEAWAKAYSPGYTASISIFGNSYAVADCEDLEDTFAAAQADYSTRILSALEPSAGRAAVLEEGDLNARLKAKGMYSIEELMGELPLDRWRVHSGMTDLKFFGEWIERKAREYLTMKAAYDVGDKDESDELYEWVLAHYGAFHDVLVNYRAAIAHPVADKPDEAGAQGEGWLPIESAPKDGTVIDLWSTEFGRQPDCYWGKRSHCCGEDGQHCDSDWHSEPEAWIDSAQNTETFDDITHWRPLPTPPSGEVA